MRRIILLLLTFLLASGTVAGSLAHATEDRAEASLFVAAIEAGCVSAPATESAESDKKNSSSGEKQQVPAAAQDRKSVAQGKSVEVRVALGGGSIIKKKKKKTE